MIRLKSLARLFAGQPAQDLCALIVISALMGLMIWCAPIVDMLVRHGGRP